MRQAAEAAADMPSFIRMVEEDGWVQVVLNEMGGHISGLSYRVDGRQIKSSALDRSLSWLNLQHRHGVSYDEERDRTALLERSATAERAGREDEADKGRSCGPPTQGASEEHSAVGAPGAALAFAAAFYRKGWDSLGPDAAAREYLRARGFNEPTVAAFGVGFAPDAWDGLTGAALEAGFTEEVLVRAGLALERKDAEMRRARGERGIFDRFRGRIMFPFRDAGGQVVGFGARRVDAVARRTPALENRPKYVNSPASESFNKGTLLFGSSAARAAIGQKEVAYVVEGYTDALRLHQEGIRNVVALAGTALRAEQAHALAAMVGPAGRVVLMLDGDTRAQSARAAMSLVAAGAAGCAVRLPAGADPAEHFREAGPDAVETLARQHGRSWAAQVLSAAQTEGGCGSYEAPEGRYGSAAERRAAINRYFEAVRRGPEQKREVRLQELAHSIGDDSPELARRIRRAYQREVHHERARPTRVGGASSGAKRASTRARPTARGYLGEEAVERIRQANPIEEVARTYTDLRPSGGAFVGLSPFKDETDPSFRVNPEKGLFFDFSSQKGGDVFTLVQELEGLSFPEAARHLEARAAGAGATRTQGVDDQLSGARRVYAEPAERGPER